MKKIGIFICLTVVFLIIYLIQVNFFSWFNLAGVMPNLFVIFVLTIGLFSGKRMGVTFGIIFGVAIDFFIGKSIGISGIMLGIVGFLGGYLDKRFSKDSRVTMIITVFMVTVIYEIGIYGFNYLINSVEINIIYYIKTLLTEIIYNIILTIIFYPTIMKYGYKLEDNFRENKILTRYF